MKLRLGSNRGRKFRYADRLRYFPERLRTI
jgi:hypothetical protein